MKLAQWPEHVIIVIERVHVRYRQCGHFCYADMSVPEGGRCCACLDMAWGRRCSVCMQPLHIRD